MGKNVGETDQMYSDGPVSFHAVSVEGRAQILNQT
jgi:hypothetical protein